MSHAWLSPTALRLGIVLTHNKGTAANRAQVTFVLGRTEVRQVDSGVPNPDTPGQNFMLSYRTFPALARENEVLCFQVVPRGVARPSNMGQLPPSLNALYGNDAAVGLRSNTRMFFNWALKRAVEEGCHAVAFIEQRASFDEGGLGRLEDFVEQPWGFLVRARLYDRLGLERRNGQVVRKLEVLRESVPFADALAELRAKIDADGVLSRG